MKIVGKIYHRTSQKVNKLYHKLNLDGILEYISAAEVELSFLFVEPDFIGKGYGRMLMMHAQEEARHLGYNKMIIEGDPNAEQFYRSAGGSVVGTRKSTSIPNRELPVFCINLRESDENPLG